MRCGVSVDVEEEVLDGAVRPLTVEEDQLRVGGDLLRSVHGRRGPGGAEQQRLALREVRQRSDDHSHVRGERRGRRQQRIRLIQHQQRQPLHSDHPLVHQMPQPTHRRDQHITAHQPLPVLSDASLPSHDSLHSHSLHSLCEAVYDPFHLHAQLARGDDDEGGEAKAGEGSTEAVGDCEGGEDEGLAGAGVGLGDEVEAMEGGWDGVQLNGGGVEVGEGGERGEDERGEEEGGEGEVGVRR